MDTKIREILEAKGTEVQTASPNMPLVDAVHRMTSHGVGSMVVVESNRPVGMLTERDVLRRVVGQGRAPAEIRVRDVMTAPVVAVSPDITVQQALAVITEARCRHLPVMEGGRMVGLLSSGDLNKWMSRDQAKDIQHLIEYINGPYATESVRPPPML
jgi:CBS domain-containing protein